MNTSNSLRELFWDNPMTLEATRTLRRFMRAGMSNENPIIGKRLNYALLGVLGFLYFWLLLMIVRTGEDASIFLLMVEVGVLTLIIPASLFGAIATEREKLTYESLIMTRLTPAQIVCGKLWWRVGVIAAVMGLFLPLSVLAHFTDIHHSTTAHTGDEYPFSMLIWAQVQIFSWSLLIAALSLWISAKSKKGITALLAIIASVLSFLALVPALAGLLSTISATSGIDVYQVNGVNHINPIRTLTASDLLMTLVRINPFCSVYYLSNPGMRDLSSNNNSTFLALSNSGVDYWVVAVYLLGAFLFLRGAIKTLRGLELPLADTRKRGR